MPNVLSFALGLETGAWTAALEAGGDKLLGFLSIAEAGRFTIDKFSEAIREGGEAFRKSFATGVSTGHLIQLTQAFKAIGLESSEVETISFRLQRALTGVSDSGERTELAFGRLRLNMRALRSMDPAQQIIATSDAFQKLNRTAQTGVASIIFGGRGGAASFLQLARQGDQFRDSFARAAQDAATFQKLGGLFSGVLTTVGEIGSHLEAGFAEAAAGFLIPLRQGLALVESIPWNKIGQDAAIVANTIFGAFQEGKLGLLLGDSIRTGFQLGAIFIGPFFSRLFIEAEAFGDFLTITLLKAFENVSSVFQNLMTKALEEVVEQIGKIPGVGKALGLSGFKAESFAKISERQQKQDDLGINALNDAMNADITGRRADNNAEFGKAWNAALNGPLKEFAGRWKDLIKPPQINGPQSQDQPGSPNALLGPPIRNASQYEKLGFVLSTVASMSGDHARQTAQNTGHIAQTVDRMLDLIGGIQGSGQNAFMHHTP